MLEAQEWCSRKSERVSVLRRDKGDGPGRLFLSDSPHLLIEGVGEAFCEMSIIGTNLRVKYYNHSQVGFPGVL